MPNVSLHISGTPADIHLTQHQNKNWKVEVVEIQTGKRFEIARSLNETELAELTKFVITFFTIAYAPKIAVKKLREFACKIKQAKNQFLAKIEQLDPPELSGPMKEFQVDVKKIEYGFVTVRAHNETEAIASVSRMHEVELEETYSGLDIIPTSATAVDDI